MKLYITQKAMDALCAIDPGWGENTSLVVMKTPEVVTPPGKTKEQPHDLLNDQRTKYLMKAPEPVAKKTISKNKCKLSMKPPIE